MELLLSKFEIGIIRTKLKDTIEMFDFFPIRYGKVRETRWHETNIRNGFWKYWLRFLLSNLNVLELLVSGILKYKLYRKYFISIYHFKIRIHFGAFLWQFSDQKLQLPALKFPRRKNDRRLKRGAQLLLARFHLPMVWRINFSTCEVQVSVDQTIVP